LLPAQATAIFEHYLDKQQLTTMAEEGDDQPSQTLSTPAALCQNTYEAFLQAVGFGEECRGDDHR
jgi:hypothetical protein